MFIPTSYNDIRDEPGRMVGRLSHIDFWFDWHLDRIATDVANGERYGVEWHIREMVKLRDELNSLVAFSVASA